MTLMEGRLNKHLFISCFHRTDGEVVSCLGKRNDFEGPGRGILLPVPARCWVIKQMVNVLFKFPLWDIGGDSL